MTDSAHPTLSGAMHSVARPVLTVPPHPALRGGLWALPLLLSLAFVAGVLTWLRSSWQSEVEDQRAALISDALSLQAQVSARIERETALLEEFADALQGRARSAEAFAAMPEVQQGLRRFWVGLTWLDASNRIVAHVPEQAPRPDLPSLSSSGLSAHIKVALPEGGTVVARYSPSEMLRQTVPWWVARKYDVRLVDGAGDVLASTAEGGAPGARESHRISLEPALTDGYLELSARDPIAPWYGRLPVAMVGGFVLLIALITWMLRRQVQDVSRAEAAWRSEAAWRGAMEDSLTVGLRARDLDGRVLYVNRALADMVGYAPEELIGRLPPMPYWPSDSIEASMQRHRRNLAGAAPRGGYEVSWRHRDGHLLEVILFEAPLVDARGQQVGWMGSILDITERKRLEERQRHQTELMAHHARLTMLGEIASTLAHELNQPLSAISSYNAGVLNSLARPSGAGTAPDPAVLRALQRLGEQAAHAGRIVQRIRQFLTRREPHLEPCALNEVVEGALSLLKRDLDRQQVSVQLALQPGLQPVMADAILIEQVIINLIRNACDALAELATHDPRQRQIEVRTYRAETSTSVHVEIRDNGPGLMGRRIEALCAPFYSTKAEGMGMGLAICRSILESHQGTLDAVDGPLGGAWFSMGLPADRSGSPGDAGSGAPNLKP